MFKLKRFQIYTQHVLVNQLISMWTDRHKKCHPWALPGHTGAGIMSAFFLAHGLAPSVSSVSSNDGLEDCCEHNLLFMERLTCEN